MQTIQTSQTSQKDFPIQTLSDGRIRWMSGKVTAPMSGEYEDNFRASSYLGKKPEELDEKSVKQSVNGYGVKDNSDSLKSPIQDLEVDKVAETALETTEQDRRNFLRIENDKTKEVKWIKPSEASEYGISPDKALAWFEAQKTLLDMEEGKSSEKEAAQDANKGMTLRDLQSKYAGSLDVKDLVTIYSANSPYGTPEEPYAQEMLGIQAKAPDATEETEDENQKPKEKPWYQRAAEYFNIYGLGD